MIIRNGDLLIRSATRDDAPILCDWWNDGSIMAHAGFPLGLGITQQKVLENLDADNNNVMMLFVDGVPVGEMNYRTVVDGVAEIGIKICRSDHQGKGYGTSFLKILLDYLFAEQRYEKIILDTNLTNTRAQHVYEKLGFRRGELHFDSWKNQLGELQSSVDYYLMRAEYLKTTAIK